MPRCARLKTDTSIYHIMVRSISEVDLFKDDNDKKTYLMKMREYQVLYGFKVYAYCLMNNHAHFIIDSNGADISKIMHGINFSYAQKYNWKYKRHGHLFQDRFKSKIIGNRRYLIALSAYIHNNPKDIKGYEESPEQYEFSSLAAYLNNSRDEYNLLDNDFIKNIIGDSKEMMDTSYKRLIDIIDTNRLKQELEFEEELTIYNSCKSVIIKPISADEIIEYISNKIGVDSIKLHLKYNRNVTEARALAVVLMRSLCNYRCVDICRILGNITQGRVSKLSSIGIKAISENIAHKEIINGFLQEYC